MNKIEIVMRNACSPCKKLKDFIQKLPKRYKENIELFEEGVYTIEDLNKKIDSVYKFSYPTLIFKNEGKIVRVITGFTYKTEYIIVDHLNANYALN